MVFSRPSTLAEALQELEQWPGSRLLAGGTDLMVAINFGRERPERVIATRGLPELRELRVGDRMVCGAGVTYSALLAGLSGHEPALEQAVRTVGSPQIRNAGTMGGNLGTCSPAGDTLPVLAALDADIVLSGRSGERRLKLAAFMLGPKQPDLRAGEAVRAAEWNSAGRSQVFLKAGSRNAMVIAVASLAMVVDRVRRRVGVGLGSVGPTVARAAEAEAFAEGLFDSSGWERPLAPSESEAKRFGELAAAAARPIDDQRGSSRYRLHAVSVMAGRALRRTGAIA